MFRHGPAQDLHAHGQRLLSTLSPLSSLQTSGVPSQAEHQGQKSAPTGEKGLKSVDEPKRDLLAIALRFENAREVWHKVLHREACANTGTDAECYMRAAVDGPIV